MGVSKHEGPHHKPRKIEQLSMPYLHQPKNDCNVPAKGAPIYRDGHVCQPPNLPHIPCKRMVALADLLLHPRKAIKALRLAWSNVYGFYKSPISLSDWELLFKDNHPRSSEAALRGKFRSGIGAPLKVQAHMYPEAPHVSGNETLVHIRAVPANTRLQFWLRAAYL